MNVEFTEEQYAFREAAHRFADEKIAPLAAEFDLTRALTRAEAEDLLTRVLGAGILDEPPEHEDGSSDLLAEAMLAEELARAHSSVAGVLYGFLFAPSLLSPFFTADQTDRYSHLLDRRHLVSVAITEPEAGSNPAEITTQARRDGDGDGWIIEGSKLWITNASISDACVVLCRVEGREGRMGIAPFLVEREHAPYDATPVPCIGWQGVPTCEVSFRDCRVPSWAELGGEGSGFGVTLQVLQRARCFVAITSVGIAQAALDLAIAYARERTQFGRPIAGFQLVQEMLADMAIEIEAGRLLAYRALSLLDANRPAVKEASMAKAFCTEMAVRVASAGVQVHGAIGLSSEYPAERLLRDARMMTIPDGTTQIQKLIVGRELTGISAFG